MSLSSAINEIKFKSTFWSVANLVSPLQPQKIRCISREQFKQLKHTGFIKLEALFGIDDLVKVQQEITQIMNLGQVMQDGHYEKRSGNLKIKHLQNYSVFLNDFRSHPVFRYFSLMFYGWYKRPTILYSVTSDKYNGSKFVDGDCDKQIASEPHIDSYKNYLKIIILLSDVDENNGPTTMVNSSINHPIMRAHYEKKASDKTAGLLSRADANKVVKDCGTSKLIGNAGDIYIVNTKNLHWAGSFKKGIREILWLYY